MNRTHLLIGCMVGTLACHAETLDFGTAFWPKNKTSVAGGIITFPSGRFESVKKLSSLAPSKSYRVSCRVRPVPGSNPVFAYIGFQQYEESGRALLPEYYRVIPNSQAKLLKNASAGSKIMEVSIPHAFHANIVRYGWMLALDTDGTAASVPNFQVLRISEAACIENKVQLTLETPLKEDWNAGTPVCFHTGGPGMYSLLAGGQLPATWTTFSAMIEGFSTKPENDKWWQDATSAALLFIFRNLPNQTGRIAVEVSDIRLEVIELPNGEK